jgi:hypothetical protein
MKQLQSVIENYWVELKQVVLTQEEKELLTSTSETDKEVKKVLMERIKAEREVVAEEADLTLVQAAYDSIKPVLKESDTYQLISVNFTINSGVVNGILNCRVNGEHKQIRL